MSDTTLAPTLGATSGTTTKQKVGLVLGVLLSLSNVPSAFVPPDTGDQAGPPMSVLVLGTILGVVGLVACVVAWRGSTLALRVGAGAISLATLTSVPAFFVDIPTAIKVGVAITVLVNVVAVALMFSWRRRGEAVA